MALYINGVGQDTFSLNGVNIDNLYVDNGGGNVLVWSSAPAEAFLMTVTTTTEPTFFGIDGTLSYVDNNDGTWDILGSGITRIYPDRNNPSNRNITQIEVKLTSSLTSMYAMFWSNLAGESNILSSVHTILFNETVDTSNVVSFGSCFRDLPLLDDLDLTNVSTASADTFNVMFWDCSLSGNVIIPNNFVSPPAEAAGLNVGSMFANSDITSLDVSNYDILKATSISSMFQNTNLVSLDLSGWDVSNIQYMYAFLEDTTTLEQLDLTGWNTSSLISIGSFVQNTGLTHLDLTSWTFTTIISFNFMFADCPNLECITNLDTTNVTSAQEFIFNNSANIVQPDAANIALLQSASGYNWTNPNPCPAEPPVYLLTEALITAQYNGETYWYVVNSSSSGAIYHGRLEHTGDGFKAEGAPWEPGVDQYNQLGWIDLTIQGDGDGSRRIVTQWIAPQTSEWTMFGTYNLLLNVGYDAYAINYKGNNTCNIYLGDQDTDFTTDFPDGPTYEGVTYTPPSTEWIITEDAPEVIFPNTVVYDMKSFILVDSLVYTMDSFIIK